MPGTGMQDLEIRAVMAYLGTVGRPPSTAPERGDRANGERIYWETANCGACHRIGDRGGWLGPDLTRIGGARSRAALVREVRTASEFIVRNYEAVTLVTGDGSRVRGAVKNEDTFSIQIMDSSQRLRAFLKSDLRELTHEDRSLMPDYPQSRLSDRDLDDLLRYLRE
jgi:putative heme-binding domain-containing protein